MLPAAPYEDAECARPEIPTDQRLADGEQYRCHNRPKPDVAPCDASVRRTL